jgi:hypothetical protein
MLNSGKDIAAVLQNLEICDATYQRWRKETEWKISSFQKWIIKEIH